MDGQKHIFGSYPGRKALGKNKSTYGQNEQLNGQNKLKYGKNDWQEGKNRWVKMTEKSFLARGFKKGIQKKSQKRFFGIHPSKKMG